MIANNLLFINNLLKCSLKCLCQLSDSLIYTPKNLVSFTIGKDILPNPNLSVDFFPPKLI